MTFKKYPEIKRLGDDENKEILAFDTDRIILEEKVDGANFSMWLEKDEVHFGSRNRDLTLEQDKKMFKGFQEWMRIHLAQLSEKEILLNPNYIYYLECMASHTIKYDNPPPFIGIDIRLAQDKNSDGPGLFLAREGRVQEFDRIQIENVPLVWEGTAKELKLKNVLELIPKSKYYNGLCEGVVIKNYNRKSSQGNYQIYAKVVRDSFKEDNKAVFGSVKNKVSDTQKIIDEFATEGRIMKAVLHFIDEGDKLELKLMSKVPHYVIKDILKEEIVTIMDKYKFIDLSFMKKAIPKKCLNVINQMILVKGGL